SRAAPCADAGCKSPAISGVCTTVRGAALPPGYTIGGPSASGRRDLFFDAALASRIWRRGGPCRRSDSRPRDVAVAGGGEAPGQLDGMRDADASADRYVGVAPTIGATADANGPARERAAVLVEPDAERLCELAGPGAEVVIARGQAADEPAPDAHLLDPVDGRERADQHGGADAFVLADGVEHCVDAVGAVDVGAAGAAEQHLGARG